MQNVIVIPTHISGVSFLENLLASFNGYSKYPILIVINQYNPSDFSLFSRIAEKFSQLSISIETIDTNSFEFGGLYTAYKKTEYENMLLLPHSCEILDTRIFDIVFERFNGKSIAFSIHPGAKFWIHCL
jgi:hypothetical protein